MRLADLPVADIRRRIVVSEADPVLFAGTLRARARSVGPRERRRRRSSLRVSVANAEDILDSLPEGLDAPVEERGRSFSGGQRQRLVLARALLSDAEVLVLVEPTSAVDAHTEARIARPPARRARRPDDRDRDVEPAACSTAPTASSSSTRAAPSPRARTASCCAREPAYREVVTRGEEL